MSTTSQGMSRRLQGPLLYACLLLLLVSCQQSPAADDSDPSPTADAVADLLTDIRGVEDRHDQATEPLIADCMQERGFEYENGEPSIESTESERLAWGLALFGAEDDTVEWVDGDGNVVGEIPVGGCLGDARDAVASRQSYLDLQQIRWDAETLNGAAIDAAAGNELDAKVESLEESWRGLRHRILTDLANPEQQ